MTFYLSFAMQVEGELRDSLIFFERILNLENNQADYLENLDLSDIDIRITLINPDGKVLYDNVITDESQLENHSAREEIKQASENGIGEEKRLSETIGEETYYYAVKLSDFNILRVSKTTSSVYGVFASVLPQSLLITSVILIACLIIARRLTKNIVDPINNFNFDENTKIYDELSPFVRTITNQKEQIESALFEVTKKSLLIEAITGNMSEGLILTNKDGIVISANKSAMSILNINSNPIQKNILETIRNINVLEHMKKTLSGENSNIFLNLEEKVYHLFFSSVDNGALILFLDVTEKAKAEKLRREFTANVSHELKTPLTTISGFAELLLNGMIEKSDITNVSAKMKSESDRLLSLIEDIMRLSELDESDESELKESESEKVFEKFSEFNLSDLICEVVENLKLNADKNNISISYPQEEFLITANRPMIFELLFNLIDNAVKYNKENGNVEITVLKLNDKIEICIKDSGIGIEKKYHERIFERFYRVDKSRSKKIGGTGLGLSIVKHIVAYHNGMISIESEINSGTKIKIIL